MKNYLLALIATALTLLTGTAPAQQCQDNYSYVGAFGGVNFLSDIHTEVGTISLKSGYLAGANVGYCPCPGYRIEAEFSERYNRKTKQLSIDLSEENGPSSITRAKMSFGVKTYALMANAYADFENLLGGYATPYVGVGIGHAWNQASFKVKHQDLSAKIAEHSGCFAFQAITGVNIEIFENIKLGMEYRYFNPGKHLNDHAVVLTLTHVFNAK